MGNSGTWVWSSGNGALHKQYNFKDWTMIKKATTKFKMTYKNESPYAPGGNTWAFVKKVKGGFECLSGPMSCKDYIHEGIANKVNEKHLFGSAGTGPDSDIRMDRFQIAMFFDSSEDNFKANLYSIKKYINSLEKAAGIKQTLITEADSGWPGYRAFVLTCSVAYIESPALHHGLVAMMRTLHYAKVNITKTNVENTITSLGRMDSSVLKFMIEHKVYDLLLKNHKKIKAIGLKSVYPDAVDNLDGGGSKVTSYHSGFGMVAVCNRRMASKAYSKVVSEILDEAKVPKYSGG